MIVISNSLVLSQAPAPVNANNPVVGYQNLTTVANVSADTEDIARPAANLANPMTHLRWLATNTTEQYVTIDHAAVDEVDYVGIAGHNFGSAQIPVSVEGDDGGGFDELVAPVMLPDDGPAIFRFTPTSLQSVRVRLQSGLAAPTAAVVYVGRLLVLPRRLYVGHKILNYNRRSDFSAGYSENGQFLGNVVISETATSQLDMGNIAPVFYRSSIEPWRKTLTTTPFFFAWRPGAYPRETGYCWLPQGAAMAVDNQRTNGMMQISMPLQGIVS